MSDNNDGFASGLLGGLLGPSDEDLDALRKKYGIPAAEAPPTMARIGRGMVDVWEPFKQMYLNAYHPALADAYRVQRREDEQLYQRGLLSGNPQPMTSAAPADDDTWRMVGRGAVAAPFLIPGVMSLPATAPEIAMSAALTGGVYTSLDDIRRRLGILTD